MFSSQVVVSVTFPCDPVLKNIIFSLGSQAKLLVSVFSCKKVGIRIFDPLVTSLTLYLTPILPIDDGVMNVIAESIIWFENITS